MRVSCLRQQKHTDLAMVTWFPPPVYPDSDPLLVKIDLNSEIPEGCPLFLLLSEIDPSPVMYELDDRNLFMMRLRGLDTNPLFT